MVKITADDGTQYASPLPRADRRSPHFPTEALRVALVALPPAG